MDWTDTVGDNASGSYERGLVCATHKAQVRRPGFQGCRLKTVEQFTTRHPFHSKHTNIQKETQNLLVLQSLRTAVVCIFLCFHKFLFYFYCFNCIGWSASDVTPIVWHRVPPLFQHWFSMTFSWLFHDQKMKIHDLGTTHISK